ncbi:OmpW/AlkL family protein [Oleisolibacter albus]|uniref:OmpW/AlkL family protein n=1 Tax=Oleisolibacter albus TaxID=2171757 RepID=UPI000DF33037|nr:OmpW family protein [Oleisolibacter albus]
MRGFAGFAAMSCAAVALLAAAPQAHAEKAKGDLIVRSRAVLVTPDEDVNLSVGGAKIAGKGHVSDQVIPELDFSYFFTDNIAAELILGTTQHEVSVTGTPVGDADLGSVWLLPPTLTLQYHFAPKSAFSPYVGAGINYTIFYGDKESKNIKGVDVSYDNSFGWALQAGVDYFITDRLLLNFDVKKIFLNTDVKVKGLAGIPLVKGDADIDPWLIGVGIGYRF